jgi:HEAT repeat protein
MQKDNLRRDVWLAVGMIAVLVIVGWLYVLSNQADRKTQTSLAPTPIDSEIDGAVAKPLPEFQELKANFPLRPGSLKREKAVRIIELADHSNAGIRVLAGQQLGFVDDTSRGDALSILTNRLHDPNLHVRINAMDALAVLGAKDHIPELLPFLTSEDPDERACAKRALLRLGHPVE